MTLIKKCVTFFTQKNEQKNEKLEQIELNTILKNLEIYTHYSVVNNIYKHLKQVKFLDKEFITKNLNGLHYSVLLNIKNIVIINRVLTLNNTLLNVDSYINSVFLKILI